MIKVTHSRNTGYMYCFQSELVKCDIAPLSDGRPYNYNAGFVAIKATMGSRRVYALIKQMTNESKTLDDQKALNRAIRMTTRRRKRDEGVPRANVLDRNQFLSGLDYFERSGRKFPKVFGGCKPLNTSKCPLVVHNNWIVGKEAKVYRFREHLMWLYDGNDQYYSSETRKYLMYTNPKPTTSSGLPKNVTERELSALRTALAIGHLLDRVVILPRFHCGTPIRECPLNSIVHIKTFDARFAGRYRENSFLKHPKVPDSVKHRLVDRRLVMHGSGKSSGAVIEINDILRQFGDTTAAVLNVGSLLDVQVVFDETSDRSKFVSIIQKTFRRSNYRQQN